MTDTPNLKLPYLLAAQAQKHVTHNEAIRILDGIVQLSVLDRNLATPPASPANGDRYLVAASPTGAWAGAAGRIAAYQDGAWMLYVPKQGWISWVADEAIALVYNGSAWVSLSTGAASFLALSDTPANYTAAADKLVKVNAAANAVEFDNKLPILGINATPDMSNRLAVASSASLFNHAGNGHQVKVNKNAAADTASVVFQTGFSGRAEFGLAGDDDWHVKVSPDGTTWKEVLVADRTTGLLKVQGFKSAAANNAQISSLVFTPGGDGVISIYRIDTTSTQNPRTATIASISGDTITLTAAVADAIFSSMMGGVCYARMWNTSLSADQHSAWVKTQVSGTQLKVTSAANLAGWAAGHTVQIGDPTTITPGRCITLDISPMLINLFGQAFRQTGIIVKAGLFSGATGDLVSVSPSGVSGSFTNCALFNAGDGNTLIPCSELSPISNSNLVRIRETIATTAGIRLVSSIAVLV